MTRSGAEQLRLPVAAYVQATPELRSSARHLLDLARRFYGLEWRIGGVPDIPGAKALVVLAINMDDPRFDVLSPPTGVSPRGFAPREEQYCLTVTDSRIELVGRSEEGVLRGLSTLIQLFERTSDGVVVEPVAIIDGPRYAWRGLSLDVVRTFFTLDEVKQVIDMLSLYKLNVLHLHLTDDQGWRIEIEAYPELTRVGGIGAMDDRRGGFYTKAQFAEIVSYAAERFITVIPEVEMPAHVGAAMRSLPDLAVNTGGRQPWFDPDDAETREFVRTVLGEVAAQTSGPFIHIAGDEAAGMPDDSYVRFVEHAVNVVRELGKEVVGWQEIGRAGVASTVVVQYWVSFTWDPATLLLPENLPEGVELTPDYEREILETYAKAAADAERLVASTVAVLLSPASFVYLDTPYGELSSDAAQEEARGRLGIAAYGGQTVEAAFDWEPAAVLPGAAIAGVEGAVWCETVQSFDDLQFLLLPRLPGIAERAWSTRPGEWSEYRVRLGDQARLWDESSWTYFRASSVWP